MIVLTLSELEATVYTMMSRNLSYQEHDHERSASGAQLVCSALELQSSELSSVKWFGAGVGVEIETVVSEPTLLSDGEQRVVNLVRAGKSNQAIAIELSISRRTVEAHLTRVFRKFEIGSRLQLALLEGVS
jgi:DNA-binding CsgD family transcriptional regulator